jgi:hypothetical protein
MMKVISRKLVRKTLEMESLDKLIGNSSESMTPFTKFKYLGTNSTNSSLINTLLTYNLREALFPL